MRFIVVAALCAALAGCGLARQQEAQQQRDAAVAGIKAGIEECNQRFPKEQKTAVVRSHCLADATAPYRSLWSFPDLYDQEASGRNMLAEKWQKGQITQAEYEFQFSQMHSQIESEGQRRNLAGRSVNAQEATAAAANSPTICNRVGNTTICN
jgi:hypothetical protein